MNRRNKLVIERASEYLKEVLQSEGISGEPHPLLQEMNNHNNIVPLVKFVDIYSNRIASMVENMNPSQGSMLADLLQSYDPELTLAIFGFLVGAMPYFNDENASDQYVAPSDFLGMDIERILSAGEQDVEIIKKYDTYIGRTINRTSEFFPQVFQMYDMARKSPITHGTMGRVQLIGNMIISGVCFGRAIFAAGNQELSEKDFPVFFNYYNTIKSYMP